MVSFTTWYLKPRISTNCLLSSKTNPRLTWLTPSIMSTASTSAWLLHSTQSNSKKATNFSGTSATPSTNRSQLVTPCNNGLLPNGSPETMLLTLGTSCTMAPWCLTSPILMERTRLHPSSATSPILKQRSPPLSTQHHYHSTRHNGTTTSSAKTPCKTLRMKIMISSKKVLQLYLFQTTTSTSLPKQDSTSTHRTLPRPTLASIGMAMLIHMTTPMIPWWLKVKTSSPGLVLNLLPRVPKVHIHQSTACLCATVSVCVSLVTMTLGHSRTSSTEATSHLPQVGKSSMKMAPSGTNQLQLSHLFSTLLTVPMTSMVHSPSLNHQPLWPKRS